jgi:hypothetical protein
MTVFLLLVGLAQAGEPLKLTQTEGDQIRVTGTTVSNFPLDKEGNWYGADPLYTHRARVGLKVGNEKIAIQTQWDLLTGLIGDNTWDVVGAVDARGRHQAGLFKQGSFKPRRASVLASLPAAQVEAGLVTSHWGLGMIANDGAHDPWFGVTDFGDRVIRMRMTTRPGKTSPLSITAAFDRVVEDDMARWTDGQWADQGVLALMYADRVGRQLGVYAVARHQQELYEERDTRAQVLDVYGSAPIPIIGAYSLTISGEAAGITGKTNRATTYGSPTSVRIQSAGATGLVSYARIDGALAFHLSGGWASGDGNPDDEVSHDFRFDRDFGVGQVLFDEFLGSIDAAAHHTLSDPQYSGQAPDGLDATVNEGAFQRASFLQPVVEVQPMDWLKARVGGAVSWSTGPISQRFYTYRAGGTPHNHHNQPTSGYHLGTELDWSLDIGRLKVPAGKRRLPLPSLVLSGGHLLIGESLQGAGPDRIDLYRAMLRL